jgi:hypothetical protein
MLFRRIVDDKEPDDGPGQAAAAGEVEHLWHGDVDMLFRLGLATYLCSCQMVYFQTKNTNLGKFCSVLQRNMLVYFMAIWYFLWPFGIFMAIWYFLWPFGIFCGHFDTFFTFWLVVPRKIW